MCDGLCLKEEERKNVSFNKHPFCGCESTVSSRSVLLLVAATKKLKTRVDEDEDEDEDEGEDEENQLTSCCLTSFQERVRFRCLK